MNNARNPENKHPQELWARVLTLKKMISVKQMHRAFRSRPTLSQAAIRHGRRHISPCFKLYIETFEEKTKWRSWRGVLGDKPNEAFTVKILPKTKNISILKLSSKIHLSKYK